MIPAGQRTRRVLFVRAAQSTNEYNEPVEGANTTVADVFARVRYGTGQERREAAQEQASQPATFECNYSATLGGVLLTDKIQFDGADWDITNRALVGMGEIHFTATRLA